MCHYFKKDDSNVNATEVEAKGERNGKTDYDDLSNNSSNENEIIESDVESADEYDDSSDDDSTVTDSGDNRAKIYLMIHMKFKTKISPTHRWIITMPIMVIMVSHNVKK